MRSSLFLKKKKIIMPDLHSKTTIASLIKGTILILRDLTLTKMIIFKASFSQLLGSGKITMMIEWSLIIRKLILELIQTSQKIL